MNQAHQIQLKKGKESFIQRRHPWIFSGALKSINNYPEDGSIVSVVDSRGTFLAKGHFHDGSIMVRVLSFEDVTIDQQWWNHKVMKALQYRKDLEIFNSNPTTNAYRLIHGEGDGLSGLIVDIYDQHAVIQCHSLGMYLSRTQVAKAVDYVFEGKLSSIYIQADKTLAAITDSNDQRSYFFKGSVAEDRILENDILFQVNRVTGQKTGFFLDQRENRKLLGASAKNKSVLNCFCFTGGFSMYALRHDADFVHSIDISSDAMDMTKVNHQLNGFEGAKHVMEKANVLQKLGDPDLQKFDIVIIDPPAFAKNTKKRHNAIKAYTRLNALAMKKVKPGGMLFTFSCSQVVTPELFYGSVRAAAIQTQKDIQIIRYLSQGPDHPINIYHPEGNYLKGMVLKINT